MLVVLTLIVAVALLPWLAVSRDRIALAAGVLTGCALLIEEQFASASSTVEGALGAPFYDSIGYQVFARGPLNQAPVAVLAVLLGIVALPAAYSIVDRGTRIVVLLLLGGSILTGLSSGSDLRFILGPVLPVGLVAAGILFGAVIRQVLSASSVLRALELVLAVKAAQAVLTASGFGSRAPNYILFYDAAVPALAGATLIALFAAGELRSYWVLGTCAAVIVAFTSRRAVLLGIIFAVIVLGLISGRRRLRIAAVVVGFTCTLAALFASHLPSNLSSRVGEAQDLLSGVPAAGDASTVGHLNDLRIGWELARHSSAFGVGNHAQQSAGLAANPSGTLYIHDEYLQSAIVRGWVGGLLMLGLIIAVFLKSVLAARDGDCDPLSLIAGIFLVISPTIFFFFPYISTTSRWPLVFGVAIGIVASLKSGAAEEVGRRVSASEA